MNKIPTELGHRFHDEGVEYFVCCVLNDLSVISIPVDMVAHVQQDAGVEEVVWPLGAYVIFQPEGLTLALFGRTNGALLHQGGNFELDSDKALSLGVSVRNMWKKLRDTPELTLQDNLKIMVHHTMLAIGGPELDNDSINFFKERLTSFAADSLGVARSRVRSNLYLVEQGYVVAELFLDDVFLDPADPRHRTINERFERYLATAKPN